MTKKKLIIILVIFSLLVFVVQKLLITRKQSVNLDQLINQQLYAQAKELKEKSLNRFNFIEKQDLVGTYTFYLTRSLPTNEHLTNFLSNMSFINLNSWQKDNTGQYSTSNSTNPNESLTVYTKTQENVNFNLIQFYRINYQDSIKKSCPCTIYLMYDLKIPSYSPIKNKT